jgi:hypothetical protein
MNRQTFFVLAAIAVVLAALAIFSQRGGNSDSIAGNSAGQLLLPSLADTLDAIDRIEVDGAGGERLVGLTLNDDGWTVAELGDYPAATAAINALLIELAEARIVEEKTADPAFYDRLGVEPVAAADAAGLALTLQAAAGERFAVVLGDAYGSGQRYARLADGALSVLIDRDPRVARSPADWVQAEILNVTADRIERVRVIHADGEELVIAKPAADAIDFSVEAIPEGRELQYASIANSTGSVLAALTLEEVAPREESAEEPLAIAEFASFDGLVVTVTARGPDADDVWLSFSADAAADAGADAAAEAAAINAVVAGWQYRIPAYKNGQLLRRMEDLLRDPPAADE